VIEFRPKAMVGTAAPTLTPRQELLLAYIAAGPEEVDPIRIVKGLFVFCQEVPRKWVGDRELYEFEPYNWGPFSFDLYRDLEVLKAAGLVVASEHPASSLKHYVVTGLGEEYATRIRKALHPQAIHYLEELRKSLLSMDFNTLLRVIYKKYPEFAVNSVFGH